MRWLNRVMLRLLIENTLDRRIAFMIIKDIGRVVTGKTPLTKVEKYYGGDIMFISPSDLHGDYLIEKSEKTITEEGLKSIESNIIKGISVLTGCIGWDMGNVAMCNSRCATNQQINAITDFNDELVDPKYIYYWLKGKKEYLFSIASVTRTPILSKSVFENIDIPLPSLKVQKKIVKLVSCIDEKIRKNNHINDYLEEMAETIYDYWFVQFDFPDENGKPYKSSGGKMVWNDKLNLQIPNTWQSTELSSYGKIISGGTPSTENEDFYADDGIAWITPNDLSNNTSNMFISHGERDISLQGLNNSSANLIPSSSILLSTRAPIGYIAVSMNELTTNQGFKTLVPNDTDNTSFLYYLIKRNIPYLEQMGTGTTFKEVSKNSMEHLTVILPSDNILAHFFQKIKPYITLRKSYEQETKKLISIRNWLLPIVMNGQATIED